MIKVIPQFIPKEPFTFLVSGGVDSIAAAHWLKHHYHKKFSIVHFNHCVQDDNDIMEEYVCKFCEDNDIECCYNYRTDTFHPDTSENGLRQWRLDEMNTIGGKFVTAHHLNDACENYLDNCFKGNPEHKPIKYFSQFNGFSIYHPFIRTTKQDFIDYAKKNDLGKYIVNDSTNSDTKYKRNWIRHKIIPEINSRNLGLEKVVLKKFYPTPEEYEM
jgi:tRNA(Ile)-lysidine synthase